MRKVSVALMSLVLVATMSFSSMTVFAGEASVDQSVPDTNVAAVTESTEEAEPADAVPAVDEIEGTTETEETPAEAEGEPAGTDGTAEDGGSADPAVDPAAEFTPQWVDDEDGVHRYYYEDGKYYTDADGKVEIDGNAFFFDSTGAVRTGWIEQDGKWYYAAKSRDYALFKSEIRTINGKNYCFRSDNSLATGLFTLQGVKYYAPETGNAPDAATPQIGVLNRSAAGFVTYNGSKYYVYKSGKRLVPEGDSTRRMLSVKGTKYIVNASGKVLTGWITMDGKKYYGAPRLEGGLFKYEIRTISGVNYCFRDDCSVATGLISFKGVKYYAPSSGKLTRSAAGFVTYNGKKYYVYKSGKRLVPEGSASIRKISVDNIKYFVGKTGAVKKGVVKYDGNYYYAYTGSGKVRTTKGHYTSPTGEHYYVLTSTGKLASNKLVNDGTYKYVYRTNCTRVTGICSVKGTYYFCDPNNSGRVKTKEGKFKYKGKFYYAKDGGKLYKSAFIVNGETVYHASSKAYLNTSSFTAKSTTGKKYTMHPNSTTARIPFSDYAKLFDYPAPPSSTDPCVVVDISDQTLYFYDNGKLVFKTPVVTGKIYGQKYHGTPTGTFHILYKQRDQHLRGLEDDGKTKYDSFVNYWMPFRSDGYGLHDAPWRGAFGGTIYQYSGSHGCVNMPPSYAKRLYNSINVGSIVKIQK